MENISQHQIHIFLSVHIQQISKFREFRQFFIRHHNPESRPARGGRPPGAGGTGFASSFPRTYYTVPIYACRISYELLQRVAKAVPSRTCASTQPRDIALHSCSLHESSRAHVAGPRPRALPPSTLSLLSRLSALRAR